MRAWLEQRVLITVGTGGVGKTTVAAAIALEGARQGKRVLVLTIDPARRLADALGIGELGHEPRVIPPQALREAGLEGPGELSAMMLDTKRTFDELVARYAPNEEARVRILANPIYRNLTDALAGSREYSALERLHQLHGTGQYDLIVVDTPPSTHAIEFLEAPRRLTGFLESQFLKLLFRPALAMGRTGFRLFRLGSATVLRVMEKLSGLEFLMAISEFLLAFEGMLEGFTRRSQEIETLLHDRSCGFVLVVGPEPEQVRRAEAFWRRLCEERIHLLGVIVNRMRVWPGGGAAPELDRGCAARLTRWLEQVLRRDGLGEPATSIARHVVETLQQQAALARRDAVQARALTDELALSSDSLRCIPLYAEDVHALEGLARMSTHLFKESTSVGI